MDDALFNFNKTWIYKGNDTQIFSDESWEEFTPHTGIVTLSEQWAEQHGIPPSAPNPDKPGDMIYQVDLFHQLHCLHFVRRRWLENRAAPGDLHIAHCLNYLRRTIMCNIDLVLGTTIGYEDYGIFEDELHVCRDYDAVVEWTETNKWEGFMAWHKAFGDPEADHE